MEENKGGAWDDFAKAYRMGATHPSFDEKDKVCEKICMIRHTDKDSFSKCMHEKCGAKKMQ